MKKVLSLLFLSTLLFVSCGDDDDSSTNSVDNSLIVGTWDYTDAELETTVTTTAGGQSATQTSSSELTSSDATITFNADGTFSAAGTTTFENTSMGSPASSETNDITGQTGTYVITGNQIVFTGETFSSDMNGVTFADSVVTYTITELTASRFVMDLDSTFEQDLGGASFSGVFDGFILLTK